MFRKIVAIWLNIAIMVGFIIILVEIAPLASGIIITVDDDGQADYSKIQDAINASSDGDTIYVFSGTYYEHVVVNRTVELTGQSSSTTIINGNLSGTVVSVETDEVQISNFTITDSGWDERYGTKGYEYGSGIVIHSHRNIVKGCYFQNIQKMPIYFPEGSNQNHILNNTFTGEYMNALRFDGGTINEILIRNNSFLGPSYGIVTYSTGNFNDGIIEGNYFHGSRWIGISLRYGNRVIIKDNYIEGYATGIKLLRTSDTIVFSNTLFNNSEEGILVEDSNSLITQSKRRLMGTIPGTWISPMVEITGPITMERISTAAKTRTNLEATDWETRIIILILIISTDTH
jgi:parallel beta-helix repeat protein